MSKKDTYLEKYLELMVGGKVTSSQDLATDLDVDVTSRSKYDSCRCSRKLSMVEGRFSKWF